jgi:hypothetical protein
VRLVALGALVLLVCGCKQPAIDSRPSDNANISVDLLLTIDGCKVYRFYDNGSARYVTICPDYRRTSTIGDWVQSTGKAAVNHPSTIDAARMP